MPDAFRKGPAIQSIIRRYSEAHQIPLRQLVGQDRRRAVSDVRQAAMWEASRAGYSVSEIGRALGGRDHSTIAHGITAHGLRMAAQAAGVAQ